MTLLVNEVFKVYNYVLVHNCIQQYKVGITLFFYDLWLLWLLKYVYLWHMYMYVYLSIVKKLYVIILMEQLL